MKKMFIMAAAGLAVAAQAEFKLDRSAMSEEYWKIWNDDVQRRIDADIEKYRKADASVSLEAPDGAEVKVEQLTHAFFFGAHIFNFGQLGKKEWNDRYKELYGTLFNSAPRREHSAVILVTVSRPALCPKVRSSPRSVAQRPLPSMMMAMC